MRFCLHPTRHSFNLLPTVLLLASGAALEAQPVTVTPKHANFAAGTSAFFVPGGFKAPGARASYQAAFQFHARLENSDLQPTEWDWSLVDKDGKTVLADAGSISTQGIYTPPAVSLSKYRFVWVKATAHGNPDLSGMVRVVIRPHMVSGILEHIRNLGKGWRGPRIEWLAGGAGVEYGKHLICKNAPAGTVAFYHPVGLAYAAMVPLEERILRDQWVVLDDQGHLFAVGEDGKVNTLGIATPPAMQNFSAGNFSQLAVRPWDGKDAKDWECFLWDDSRKRLCRMDAKGACAWVPGNPGETDGPGGDDPEPRMIATERGMAVDSKGVVYLAILNKEQFDYIPGAAASWPCIRRWDPKAGWSTLASTTRAAENWEFSSGSRPKDGRGPEARFGLPAGIALDDRERTLYVCELRRRYEPDGKAAIRVIDLNSGQVSTLALNQDDIRLPGEPREYFYSKDMHLVFRNGKLLTMPSSISSDTRARLVVIDAKTGASQVAFQSPDNEYGLKEGICQDPAAAARDPKAGRLGIHISSFALGPHGQVAFGSGQKLGLLLLETEAPGTPFFGMGGEKADGKAQSSPAPTPDSKADSKSGSGNAAGN